MGCKQSKNVISPHNSGSIPQVAEAAKANNSADKDNNETATKSGMHKDDNFDDPLTPEEIDSRIVSGKDKHQISISSTGDVLNLDIAWVSQRGFYPEALSKANQDSFVINKHFGSNKRFSFFGVFDGHGKFGDKCSIFVRNKVGNNILHHEDFEKDILKAYSESFVKTNQQMHKQRNLNGKLDDTMSGTTAISILFDENVIHVANVGDSRAILCSKSGGKLVVDPLSIDQTPFREDERNRCIDCGARVLTMDQIDGYKDPNVQQWGTEEDDGGDPPRLWLPDRRYPGTAFTRSIGDAVAEMIGVMAEPELNTKELDENDKYLVIASDGVFEFLSNQSVCDMVSKFDDPLEACRAIVSESYRLWLQYEVRTDDITCIVIHLNGIQNVKESLLSDNYNEKSTTPLLSGISNIGDIARTKMLTRKTTMNRPVRRALARAKRMAVNMKESSQLTDEEINYIPPKVFKGTEVERRNIADAVKANFLFQHLTDSQRSGVFNSMRKLCVKKDEVIINQGDPGDEFYIIKQGHFDVLVSTQSSSSFEISEPVLVHTYIADGDQYPSFGELALMYDKPRAATVRAKTDGVLWALHRTAFRSIVMKSSGATIVNVLRKVSVLSGLSPDQIQRLSDILSVVHFNSGDYIITEGDIGDTFYVVTSGKVRITKKTNSMDSDESTIPDENEKADEKEIMRLGVNSYFGERALLSGDTRAANVIAMGKVECLYIGRKAFEEVLGPLQDMIDIDRRKREARANNRLRCKRNCMSEGLIGCTLDHFDGGAVVYKHDTIQYLRMVRHSTRGSIYSLRTILKKQTKKENRIPQITTGHEIHLSLPYDCPYIPSVLATFSDDSHLYALLNSVIIVDIHDILNRPATIFETEFVAAAISVAIQVIHQNNIHLRSISTESIVLDKSGLPLIEDFRYAKETTGRSYTICGTPDYLAPEQVKNKNGADYCSDWWALGVLLFEVMAHASPFSPSDTSASELQIYENISNYKHRSLEVPTDDHDLKDLIHSLLHPDATKRLGYGQGNANDGGDEVLNHTFFSRTEGLTDQVKKGELISPFVDKTQAIYDNLVEVGVTHDDIAPGEPYTDPDQSWFADW